MTATAFRRTRCAHCRARLDPERPHQVVHLHCVEAWALAQAARRERAAQQQARAAARVERVERAQRLWALAPLRNLLKTVQRDFNAWVRARDAALPCISCGAPPPDLAGLHAGRDAGHYRSVGAAGHLRFHPDNVHAQCVRCNLFLAGNAVAYRAGLLQRIGAERLHALEADHTPRPWRREQLRLVREAARQATAHLKTPPRSTRP